MLGIHGNMKAAMKTVFVGEGRGPHLVIGLPDNWGGRMKRA